MIFPLQDSETISLERNAARLEIVQTFRKFLTHLSEIKKEEKNSFSKQNMAAFLLTHAVRTWRNTQPKAIIRINVRILDGKRAVYLSLLKVKITS